MRRPLAQYETRATAHIVRSETKRERTLSALTVAPQRLRPERADQPLPVLERVVWVRPGLLVVLLGNGRPAVLLGLKRPTMSYESTRIERTQNCSAQEIAGLLLRRTAARRSPRRRAPSAGPRLCAPRTTRRSHPSPPRSAPAIRGGQRPPQRAHGRCKSERDSASPRRLFCRGRSSAPGAGRAG